MHTCIHAYIHTYIQMVLSQSLQALNGEDSPCYQAQEHTCAFTRLACETMSASSNNKAACEAASGREGQPTSLPHGPSQAPMRCTSPTPSELSAETLSLGFWDDGNCQDNAANQSEECQSVPDQAAQMETDDPYWYNTFLHNPPREVTMAYTDFLLAQQEGVCNCKWVTYCGKWDFWKCNMHRHEPEATKNQQ